MKEEKKNFLNDDELNNVNGGVMSDGGVAICPKCETRFDRSGNMVSHGSGCSKKFYFKCPSCSYEWEN